MSGVADFDALKRELHAVQEIVALHPKKTIRDEELRERIRDIYRSWCTTVQPAIKDCATSEKDLLKLHAELSRLAELTTKRRSVLKYKKRLRNSLASCNNLGLLLPPSEANDIAGAATSRGRQFLPGVPDVPVSLVPNALLGWTNQMNAFVGRYSFDKSVFVMVRYARHTEAAIEAIKRELRKGGLHAILAKEHKITDDLYNPVACLLCCSKGIVVFDAPEACEVFNPNVAYELGMMHLLGRELLVLKHDSLQVLPTDILMKLYEEYSTQQDLVRVVDQWIESLESVG